MTDILETTEQARKRSVTRDDFTDARSGGASAVFIGPLGLLGEAGLNPAHAGGLPLRGSALRDRVLVSAPFIESMWASARAKAISKQVALGFRLEDSTDSERRIRHAQQLMLGYDGQYTTGLQRGLQDYIDTDNGMFVEIARVSNARGARVAGLFHLDSLRCTRTGDPNWPVLYCDDRGRYHPLRAENVIMIADSPSARVQHRGVGMCATSRAWAQIVKLAAIELYFRERVTGDNMLGIHIIKGMSAKQLGEALSTAEAGAAGKGYTVYKGAPLIAYQGDQPLEHVFIPIAEIPDGFDVEAERRYSRTVYAHALGINVDDLVERPAGLNSGLSAQVADESAEGQGLAVFRKAWEHAISHQVLPGTTTFYLATSDLRDQQLKAQAQKARAERLKLLIEAQIITAAEARNISVDEGDLDPAFLPADATSAGSVTDAGKVPTSQDEGAEALPAGPAVSMPTGPAAPASTTAQKAARGALDAEIDAELAEALSWARKANER